MLLCNNVCGYNLDIKLMYTYAPLRYGDLAFCFSRGVFNDFIFQNVDFVVLLLRTTNIIHSILEAFYPQIL